MLNFVWAAAAIVAIPLLLRILVFTGIDWADGAYSMLSAAIVGVVAATFALAKNVMTHLAVSLVVAGIVAGAVACFFGRLVLAIIGINFISLTALAFDLLVGMIGAVAVCFFLIDRYVGQLRRGG